jgi:hypothetical protein
MAGLLGVDMAQTFTVGSQAELLKALSNATGGDVIQLKGGDYGDVFLRDTAKLDLTFASEVTITSADPGNPAVFTRMDVRGATNLTFDGVVFDHEFSPGDPLYDRPFSFSDTQGLTIRNSKFEGDEAQGVSSAVDGTGTGIGLSVRGSKDVVIENNELSTFWKGMIVSESQNVSVTNNDLHDMRMDGMNFAEVSGVTIEDNYLHDFRGTALATDHRDMIQFWTAGTTRPSTDIIIRGNTLDIGNGDWTQSIFMRNDLVDTGRAGNELFYRNVLIEDNVIVNGHAHGITVGETAGLIIRGNSVLHADGSRPDVGDSLVEIPIIKVAKTSSGVIITNNLAGGLSGFSGQSTWKVGNNIVAQDQDPLAANYYKNIFIASSLQANGGVHAFILLPGSNADLLGVGARDTAAPQPDDMIAARFHITGVPGEGATFVFDANLSDIGGLPPGTVATWLFGDGTTATGLKVSHTYAKGGLQDVVLALRLPDGTTVAANLTLGIEGPDVLALTARGGFESYENGRAIALPVPAAGSASGLQLGARGTTTAVSQTHLRELAATDEINLDLSLKADKPGASGELFRLHGSFVASVNAAGELIFTTTSKTGVVTTLKTSGADLADGQEHDIALRIADGKIIVLIDDVVRGQVGFTGPLAFAGNQNLVFGNPWGAKNFNGDLTAFQIRTDASDYATTPQTVVLDGSPPIIPTGQLLTGGTGNDVYTITTTDVRIVDQGGTDEVGSSSLSIDLTARNFDNIENIRQTGTANIDLFGDEGGNLLVGNAGKNIIEGRDGNDTLVGGVGADTLKGGRGDDLYIIADAGDFIAEAGGGKDMVATAIDYTLGKGIENGILTGTAYRLTGNTGNNRLLGNDSANLLVGGGGNDTLEGGKGNDAYVINSTTDRVIETADGGSDTVRSSTNITLGAHIENGQLTGTANRLTGNAADNRLQGNGNANLLVGGGGNDTLEGGKGNDTYVIDSTTDRVIETADGGYDTVRSSADITLDAHIERGQLTGTANRLTGNSSNNMLQGSDRQNRLDGMDGDDWLNGWAGNDILSGGAGNDTLVGGDGEDYFTFATGYDRDVIRDFEASGVMHDVVDIRGLDSVKSYTDLVENHLRQIGDDAVIFGHNGDFVILRDVLVTSLDTDNFLI